jgi:hypothetical protein
MSLFDSLNGLLGKRPSDEPPAPGYEHFGGEPADPHNSRYWRSIPHPGRTAVPTMADYIIEIVRRVRAHAAGIDDATGPFQHRLIDAEAEATGVAIEERYLDQVRTEQGLWADEDTIAYRHRQQADILKNQLGIADADYRAGKDALLGEPGATPKWNKGITAERHTPAIPVPGLPVPRPTTTPEPAPDPATADPGPAPETTLVSAGSGPHRKTRHTEPPREGDHAAQSSGANEADGAEAPDELDEKAA